MATIKTFTKHPDETLDYTIDWARVLTPDADAISTATWVVTGAVEGAGSTSGTRTTVYVSGGTVGTAAEATCTVVTTGGRTWVRSIALTIAE